MTIDLERAYKIAAALKLETVEECKKQMPRVGLLCRDGKFLIEFFTLGILDDREHGDNYAWFGSSQHRYEARSTDLFLPLEALKVLLPEGRRG